jgi:prepilin-type N-terminal cleavage/methylation domain-containing protein
MQKNRTKKIPASRFQLLDSIRGFTIIELLVSIAIFSLVTSFGVTVFVRSLRAQRSVVSLISANDNTSLAIEAIARELRRGRNFSSSPLGTELSFINAEQKEVIYRLEHNEEMKAITRSEDDGFSFYPVTAKNIVVEDAHFLVQNEMGGRTILPRITMSIKIGTKDRDIANVVTEIHTTVSSRGLNNPLPPNP